MNMDVVPAWGPGPGYGYGGTNSGMFGGDGLLYLLVLFLFAGNGSWGGGYGGGGNQIYPWMNQANLTQEGFRDQMISGQVASIGERISDGFSATQLGIAGLGQQVCQTGNNVVQQMYTGQIADMERSFAAQTAIGQGINGLQGQMAQCCCDNRLATCQTQNIITAEAAATRASATADTQRVMDKLCQLELDGVKAQLEAKNDTIAQLRSEVLYARGQASQVDQTARIIAGQTAAANGLVNELRSCPIPAQPVYGSQPIFTCQQGAGCGCGVA